jgi:hypothetical protein
MGLEPTNDTYPFHYYFPETHVLVGNVNIVIRMGGLYCLGDLGQLFSKRL